MHPMKHVGTFVSTSLCALLYLACSQGLNAQQKTQPSKTDAKQERSSSARQELIEKAKQINRFGFDSPFVESLSNQLDEILERGLDAEILVGWGLTRDAKPYRLRLVGNQFSFELLTVEEATKQGLKESGGRYIEHPRSPSAGPKTRLWSDDEFNRGKAITQEAIRGLPLVEMKTTIYEKPAFYQGTLPLTYRESRGFGGNLPIAMDFGDWINEFIYLDLKTKNYALANGVRAKDFKSGRILAEARLLEPFIGTKTPLVVEECHFAASGDIVFRCKAHFAKDTGFKTSETEISGKKSRDYFLRWSIGR